VTLTPHQVTMPPLLFSLPREVRDEIYEYVYPCGTYRPVTRSKRRNIDHLGAENNNLALRLVNRQVSVETTIHFYSSSIFLGTLTNLVDFLERIGVCRNLIKRIGLKAAFTKLPRNLPSNYPIYIPPLFKTMNVLPSLQTIEVYVTEANLQTLWPRLSGWTFGRLDSHVEIIVRNRSSRGSLQHPLSDDERQSELRRQIGVWRRAKGAREWKKDKDVHEGHRGSLKDL